MVVVWVGSVGVRSKRSRRQRACEIFAKRGADEEAITFVLADDSYGCHYVEVGQDLLEGQLIFIKRGLSLVASSEQQYMAYL